MRGLSRPRGSGVGYAGDQVHEQGVCQLVVSTSSSTSAPAGSPGAAMDEKIAAEAALDGIYVIRTSVPASILDAAGAVTAYKDLNTSNATSASPRPTTWTCGPVHHYLADRVRGHVLICMLACYLTWHLRAALAELTFTDQHIPAPADPVAPAQRSAQARAKDGAKHNRDGLPVYRYRELVAHLATPSTGRPSPSPGRRSRSSPPNPRPAPSLRTTRHCRATGHS